MQSTICSVSRLSICLASCLLILSSCQSTILRPVGPSGYHVILPAASQIVRLQSLPLTVRVTDANGTPIDEIPVRFRIPQTWAAVAEVDPPIVVTQDGKATTTFRSRTAGHLAVDITVEDQTETVHIAVLGEAPRF